MRNKDKSSTEKLSQDPGVFDATRVQSNLQRFILPDEDRARAFYAIRRSFSPAELAQGKERLFLFKRSQEGLALVCEKITAQSGKLVPADEPKP